METGLMEPANTSVRVLPEAARPYMWKPGQSGNPNGRPKKVANAVDKALTAKRLKAVAHAIITKAEDGDVRAFEAVRDTVDGPLPRPVQLGGDGGGPLEMVLITEHIGRTK